MHYACVEHGYCGSIKHGEHIHVSMFIPTTGPVSADAFAERVLLADNQNPHDGSDMSAKHLKDMRRAFVRIMGAYCVDASELQPEIE